MSSKNVSGEIGGWRDEQFAALAHRYRRSVIYFLRKYETPMALADLTDELVWRETDRVPSSKPDERERLYSSLYHTHLPKLAAAGLANFDAESKLVSLGSDVEAAASLLDCASVRERPGTTPNTRYDDL